MGPRLFIEQSCLFNLSETIWWNKVVKVIHICFSCSMLCTDGLLLHLVGRRHLLVYSGASSGNGELGDSIWESQHISSTQGKHSPYTYGIYVHEVEEASGCPSMVTAGCNIVWHCGTSTSIRGDAVAMPWLKPRVAFREGLERPIVAGRGCINDSRVAQAIFV